MDATKDNPVSSLDDTLRWQLLQQKTQEWRLRRAFELFREQGIEPILIKGWAAGLFYPLSHFRNSIDMDLAVSGEEFASAKQIAGSAFALGLAIDLHRELRHLDTVPWDDLFGNSVTLEVNGYPIRILRAEDHLRVLCVHWLTDGGSNRDRLWDIYYMIQNRPSDFDWTRFLESVDPHRRQWLVCCVGLASKYLQLDISNTPIATEALELPSWLTRAVETEWASTTKHVPLELAIGNADVLVKQIGKRLRPNPILATVLMEGRFDSKTRIFYQWGSFMKRILPSFRRVSRQIKRNSR